MGFLVLGLVFREVEGGSVSLVCSQGKIRGFIVLGLQPRQEKGVLLSAYAANAEIVGLFSFRRSPGHHKTFQPP